jgi:hypothetical protein
MYYILLTHIYMCIDDGILGVEYECRLLNFAHVSRRMKRSVLEYSATFSFFVTCCFLAIRFLLYSLLWNWESVIVEIWLLKYNADIYFMEHFLNCHIYNFGVHSVSVMWTT